LITSVTIRGFLNSALEGNMNFLPWLWSDSQLAG